MGDEPRPFSSFENGTIGLVVGVVILIERKLSRQRADQFQLTTFTTSSFPRSEQLLRSITEFKNVRLRILVRPVIKGKRIGHPY